MHNTKLILVAEKTYQPTPVRAARTCQSETFFRKAEERGFFGHQEPTAFFNAAHIQPQLSISHPDDPQEKEADAMADQVMRLPDAAETPVLAPVDEENQKLHRKEAAEKSISLRSTLMRQCAECAHEEQVQEKLMRISEDEREEAGASSSVNVMAVGEQIHPKAHSPPVGNILQRNGRAPPAAQLSFEAALQHTKGGGIALPAATRLFMESRFSADFSGVRIHTDSQAVAMSQQISAHAFTHGRDIYFNRGTFNPDTAAGRHLLAHELTHTIQQGASPVVQGKFQSNPQTSILHRAAAERPVPAQLHDAVARAKGEEGKVNAGKAGPDGYRLGWERLVDYFKTTLGPDKVIGSGGSYVRGGVAEQDIKKMRTISGALPPAHPAVARNGPYVRDAMPSWCGIFVFWALHKAGVPMRPWMLGGRMMTPEAAYLPGHTPQAGDIAYRQHYSHFAIVEKSSGNTVTTVNGNTAGEDNLGGQVQTRDHPLSDWTAFFDPLLLKDGPLSGGETHAEHVRALTLAELRKKVFHVDARQESHPESTLLAPPELSHWHVNPKGQLQGYEGGELEKKSKKEEEKQQALSGDLRDLSVQKKTSPVADTAIRADRKETKAALPYVPYSVNQALPSFLHPLLQTPYSHQTANKGPPGLIQRNIFGDALDFAGDALSDAYDAASDFAGDAVDWAADQLNEAKEFILEKIRDYVVDIKGYKLLTVILQRDPVTGARVPRNGHTLLDAGLDVIPVIGAGIRTLLHQTGTWNEAAQFVGGRVDDFVTMVSNIGDRIVAFIDDLSITDIRHPIRVLKNFYELIKGIIEEVVRFVCRTAEAFVEMVKRVLMVQVAGFVQRRIPRLYPFLRVAFGFDPITNEKVPRNGTHILNALFAVTDEGQEQQRQLLATGAFQKVAAWIDNGIEVFANLYQAIRTGFSAIWDVISVDSLLHPLDAFERIYNHFARPVADVLSWIGRTALFIIQAIKDALLGRLSRWSKDRRGYFLITLLIGQDPFTGTRVPFSVENVIHAFLSLMEGGEEQFRQMKESGAIDRTTNRIHTAVRRLGFTVAYIAGLFTGLWHSLRLSDLANPMALFRRVFNTFAAPVRRLVAFVVEIVKIVVEVILQIMQFPTDLIANILARAMAAWDRIKRDPIGFLKNLLYAVKQGFVQFFDRIVDHLLFGLTGWLMAELREAGVPALSDFSLRGVFTWVLAVLKLSVEALWQKLATHPRIGPEKVARLRGMIGRLEGIWTFIKDVQERGMTAIWEKIQEQLSNLWNTILDAVKNWIMEQIVNRVMARLLSMLDPTGIMAVINSAIALYRAIQSFVRYLRQMLEVVNSFVMGLADIAAGNVRTAANFLEGTMRQAMPVVIGFLANQAGLSGIGRRIGEMIGRARQMVDHALTWLVHKAVDTGFAVLERLLAVGRSAVAAFTNWAQAESSFDTPDGAHHRIYVETHNGVPQLIVASDPMPILTFLTWWEGRPGITTAKRAVIADARQLFNTRIDPLLTQIKASEEAGQPESARAGLLRSLLYQNAQLSMKVKDVMGSGANLTGISERYGLEGTTGRYYAMPDATGDDFEADHQPQAAVLAYAASLPYFHMPGINRLRRRAANRAALGWTVNLHQNRHRAGRTYGPAGNATKNDFINRVHTQTHVSNTPAQNRAIVVNLLKADLSADVTAMRAVANRPVTDPVWADINALGLPAADLQTLHTSIKDRILAAENQLLAQDMNLEN